MGNCIFAEEAPEIEIRDGLAFVVHKNGRSVAISVSNLQKFVARSNRALDRWFESRGGVVPITVRHR